METRPEEGRRAGLGLRPKLNRTRPQHMDGPTWLYVLDLEGGNFFVGLSADLSRCFATGQESAKLKTTRNDNL